VSTEATGLLVAFFQGKSHLAIFLSSQQLRNRSSIPKVHQLSSSPRAKYSPNEGSQETERTFGLQQTWQSST
jgi:hypothetical protein